MSVPNAKFEVMEDGQAVRHNRRWLKLAAAIITGIIILGLGLGLGLGLSCKTNPHSPLCSNNGGGDSGPPNSNGTGPPPTGVPTVDMQTSWQILLSETVTVDNSSSTSSAKDAQNSDAAEAPVSPNQSSSPNVTLYDIDMFLHQNLTVVQELRNKGMEVICYFSAGSYEPYRPDSWKFMSDDKGNELDGWPGEYWLDLNSENVRNIMSSRIEIAAKMNCSGIDPDNVDGYVSTR